MSYDSDTPKQIDLFNAEACQKAPKEPAEAAKSSKGSTRERASKPRPIAAPAWNGAPQYLTVKDVASYFSISGATVWRWADRVSEFPAPIRLSEGVTRWRLQDIKVASEAMRLQRKPDWYPPRDGQCSMS